MTPARRLPSWRGDRRMTRVLTELPFRYAVLTGGRWHGPASAVHEPRPAGSPGRASPTAPAGSSAHSVPPWRSPESSTARARLTMELLVAERDWEPSRPPVAPDQIGGLRVLRRGGRPRVSEAGRWNLEPRAKGLAVALRLRSRARPEPPHCQRTGIYQWMPEVKDRASTCGNPVGI